MFSFLKNEPDADQGTDEQAVIIEIDLSRSDKSSKEDLDQLKTLEHEIQKVLPNDAEWDGDDITNDEATFYIYGSNADAVFKSIRDTLKKTNFDYITITLRYGPPDQKSKEKKFTL